MVQRVLPALIALLLWQVAFPTMVESQGGDVIGFITVGKWKALESRDQIAYVAGAADALSLVSSHLGSAAKMQILRTFSTCFQKMGRGVKIEKIQAMTRDMIENAPSRFQVPQASLDRSVVAGWVELAVADACP